MARTLENFGPTLDLLRLRAPHWIQEVMINILSSSYKGDLNLNMIPFNLGFPGGAGGKEPACQCRRRTRCGSIPGSRRSPGEVHGNPFLYFCLENPMDRGAWWVQSIGCKESDTIEAT